MVILNLPYDVELHNIEMISLIEKEYVFVMSKKYKEKKVDNYWIAFSVCSDGDFFTKIILCAYYCFVRYLCNCGYIS